MANESGSATRRDERRAQQRERILTAAEQLLVVNGVERTRLRDVADAAGVSIGTVQHYFDTRDRLVGELFDWSAARRFAAWISPEPDDQNPWRRVETLVEHALAEPLLWRSRIWIEFLAMTRDEKLRAKLVAFQEAWRRPFREVIDQGIADGTFRPTMAADAIVDLMIMLVDGAEVATTLGAPEATPDQLRSVLLAASRVALGLHLGDAAAAALSLEAGAKRVS